MPRTLIALAIVAVLSGTVLRVFNHRNTPAGPLAVTREDWTYEDVASLTAVGVVRVIDGDTIVVRAGATELHVRLFGASAPEHDQRCGPAATDGLRALAGSQVLLLADQRQTDRYGRQLRYVFTPDGRSIDGALIAHGLAQAWREDGQFRERLIAIEDTAHRDRRGCLWGG